MNVIQIIYIVVLIPIDLYLFYLIWKNLFFDWDDYVDCIKTARVWDIISFFRGKLYEDWESERRLGKFNLFCGLIIISELFLFLLIF